MFEQVFDNVRLATESGIHMQQEFFKKWVGIWPGMPVGPTGVADKFQKAQKKWVEFITDMVKKGRETLETQFSTGLNNVEEAFHLVEIKEPKEFRAKSIEFWQKSIDYVRQTYEAQIRDFQAAVAKWTELVMKSAPEPEETKIPAAK